MVETTTLPQIAYQDQQTQFGNLRQLDPAECIFVFKITESDYEEESPSDTEVR